MKNISINVSEPVYRDFQAYARKVDRKASELIREAMEMYHAERINTQPHESVLAMAPMDLGEMRVDSVFEGDILDEMSEI